MRTYSFAETVDPFTETDFVGRDVVARDGSDTHEPFMSNSSNGCQPELVCKMDVAGATEATRTIAVFFAGTNEAFEH